MKRLLSACLTSALAFLAISCASQQGVEEREPASSSRWKPSWESAIRKGIDADPRILQFAPVEAIKSWCSNYASLDKEAQKTFWVHFFEALAWNESEHDPNCKYEESFGVTSSGLLQMSTGVKSFKHNCEGMTQAKLFEPDLNLACGVSVIGRQFELAKAYKDGTEKPDNPYKRRISTSDGLRSHYYFSTLNPKVNPSGYKKFVAYIRKIDGCVTTTLAASDSDVPKSPTKPAPKPASISKPKPEAKPAEKSLLKPFKR
jgi:hypothetical protein